MMVRMVCAALDGREIEVPDSAVPIHMASGWTVVEDEKVETAKADESSDSSDPSSENAEAETDKSSNKSTRRSASKE